MGEQYIRMLYVDGYYLTVREAIVTEAELTAAAIAAYTEDADAGTSETAPTSYDEESAVIRSAVHALCTAPAENTTFAITHIFSRGCRDVVVGDPAITAPLFASAWLTVAVVENSLYKLADVVFQRPGQVPAPDVRHTLLFVEGDGR